jgi:hypothetical protein
MEVVEIPRRIECCTIESCRAERAKRQCVRYRDGERCLFETVVAVVAVVECGDGDDGDGDGDGNEEDAMNEGSRVLRVYAREPEEDDKV